MAEGGQGYTGKPSPWWYAGDHFYELLQAAGARPVRDLVANLDGCSGAKAGEIAAGFRNTPCNTLSRAQAVDLLQAARAKAREVRPERLGGVGLVQRLPPFHAVQRGTFDAGLRDPRARIPFVVEAWAHVERQSKDKHANVTVLVNRTPITGDVRAYREKGGILTLYGCGLADEIEGVKGGSLDIALNITTPYCPITTDGKEPDLTPFADEIAKAIKSAVSRAHRAIPAPASGSDRVTQKSIVLDRLAEGIAKASGNGHYRFNQRQLFYVLRPFVMEALGAEPSWENFCSIITDYEAEHGNIRNMYRDPRGTLYHPHTGQDISLGTLAVEEYERPEWTFNKVLYIEKEGFFEALKAARWPERHDCALLTSKGFATRAVRDLLDLLGDGDEPLEVFCAHDADASGTLIYQTLQEETKARPRRRVEIVNIGLDPWEAEEMGLEVESVKDGGRRVAVADYVTDHEDGDEWVEWLATQRVELNAMTTPELIEWLDGKMEEHGGDKVIPPANVIATKAAERVADHLRQTITEQVLRAARIDEQIAAAMQRITIPAGETLASEAEEWLGENADEYWASYVDEVARELSKSVAALPEE